MAGQAPIAENEGSTPDFANRLGRLSVRFTAAWDVADAGGTLPDIDAYLDGLSGDELPAARLLLESIDRARRARLGPIPASAFDSPTIDTSVGAPQPTAGSSAEAVTLADPNPEPTLEPEATMAATGIFEPGASSGDEPPPTMPMTLDANATMDLASTLALSSSWGNRRSAPAGQVVPGYEILGELGRGGMGVVYKARQIRADRLVALKMVLAGAHAGEDMLARFALEAQAVAHLQHPGIVQIYDVGEHDGLPYFSLEFVEGGSLAHDIGGKPQTPRRAASIVADLAEAMAAAHARNIVHRDLKPANVLLTADGRPKITDFGLAKKLEGDSQQTRSGAIMGTPSYMSPEQALGLTHDIGPGTDQYALGAILYELLTGRPPFQGATPLETLELVRNEEPVPPRRLQPKVPADLETIALKALQKEVSKRYADTAALARDLRRFLDGEPIEARPVSLPERSWRWCRRNPKIASLYAAVAALVLVGLVGSLSAAITFRNQNIALDAERKVANAARDKAELNEKAALKAQAAERVAKLDAVEKARLARIAQKLEEEAKGLAEAKEKKANEVIKSAFEQNAAALVTIRYMTVLANDILVKVPGTEFARSELLKTARMSLESNNSIRESLARNANDKQAEEEAGRTMAGIYQRLGNVAEDMGNFDEASKDFEATQRELEKILKEFPNSTRSYRNFAASSNRLGDFLIDHVGDAQRARILYEQALDARRTWLELSLQKQAEDPKDEQAFKDEKNAQDGIAVNLWLLSKVWLALGDPVKARDYAMQEADYRAGYQPAPTNALKARSEFAQLYRRLGDSEVRLGNRSLGLEHYRKHLRLTEEMVTDNPGRIDLKPDLLHARQVMAHAALMLEANPAGALEIYLSTLAEFRKLLAAEPTKRALQDDVSMSEYYCATAYLRLHKDAEAREHYRESLKLRRALVGNNKTDIDQIALIIVLARCGELAQAEPMADAIAARPDLEARTCFHLACGYALCAGAVAKGRPVGSLSADEAAAHRKLLNRAYDLIRKSLDRGWRNPVELEIEPDLDPLRDDPDFPKLLDEARRAAEKPR